MRPDWDTYFLNIAEEVAARSTCSRLHVGAVMTRDNRIISSGYNGAESGTPHCTHEDDEPCTVAVHAERNMLWGRHWFEAYGATVYVTHAPCLSCAEMMVYAEVGRVIYRHTYRSQAGIAHLQGNGVDVLQVIEVDVP